MLKDVIFALPFHNIENIQGTKKPPHRLFYRIVVVVVLGKQMQPQEFELKKRQVKIDNSFQKQCP